MHEARPAVDEVPDYLDRNAAAWDRWALTSRATARAAWRGEEPVWGIWKVPESTLQLLHDLEPGADVIELGCGTAAIPAWLVRRGMHPVGVDFSRRQLETVDQLRREFDVSFPTIRSSVENVPFESGSFDLALSEYGASVWSDPRRWLPEAHRLLRPDGRLIFFTSGAIMMSCTPLDGGPVGESLVSDYFDRFRLEFPGEDTVEFHCSHSDWVRALRETGFVLDDLIEVRPPPNAESQLEFASLEWARRWPTEEIWIARKVDS